MMPAVLGVGGYLFNWSENRRTQRIADQQRQDDLLQAYLDQIGQLLLEKDRPLRKSAERDEVRILARARTLSILGRLDGERKRNVVEFLYESGLLGPVPAGSIEQEFGEGRDNHWEIEPAIVLLSKADLNLAYLQSARLPGVDLRNAYLIKADLSGAILSQVDLRGTILWGADLRSASLSAAKLRGANLRYADLSGAEHFGADLSLASLVKANLRGASLGANWSDANLSGVVGVTNEVIEQQAFSLERTTMPNGQKYEEWIKGRREENSGLS
jgi:uncharacterized protein YjbI with pentapeptide repeats